DGDRHETEAFEWQYSRLCALEPVLTEFVAEAPAALRRQLARARDQALVDILQALVDLRVDAGDEVLALIRRLKGKCPELAVEALTWTKHPGSASWLREHAARHVPLLRRSLWRRGIRVAAAVPDESNYPAILRALRGHPSAETERFLILAA